MNKLLLCIGFLVVSFVGYSQGKSSWTAVSYSPKQENDSESGNKLFFKLNETEFKQKLTTLHSKTSADKGISVAIPNGDGKIEQFVVVESSNFAPELQAQYPEIRAYSGTGITDPKASIFFSVSPKGIQTMVLRGDSGSEFIESSADDKSLYVVLTSKNRSKAALPLNCKTVDVALNKDLVKKTSQIKSNNGVFKTMRLALSCTGEYAAYFGGTVADALAGMNATMTRVNGVFNKDLALKLEIIANNNLIVYTNATTDPYSDATDGANGAWNLELQSTLTSVIGNGGYDIGHLFGASGGGGDAGCIGCVCVNPSPSDQYGKGSAFTSPSNNEPERDSFDIDYVAHEMGHQLGANHTFSYDVEGTGVSVEPGSGSTIMGYAGISDGYDVQNQSDDYFSYASILQIQSNLVTKCAVNTILSNQTPVANAGIDYIIPKSTAFVLNGVASDPNGNALTYCWEQNDSAAASEDKENSLAKATKLNGPNFRSFLPSNSTSRYFPALSRVVAGQLTSSWESVSSIARDLNFVFTVRDNAALGFGQTNSDGMVVSVDENKGPFVVTSQNAVDVSWTKGSTQMITWSVNGTSSLFGSANVNIKLSTDGGLTFPTVLASNTPNDGSEAITVPAVASKNCRILVEPTGNIFYAVNSVPFAINYSLITSCNTYTFAAPYSIPDAQAAYTEKTIVVPATSSEITDVNLNIGFTHTYFGDLQIEVMSPSGKVVKLFDRSCGQVDGSLVLTYDDLGGGLICNQTTSQTVVPAGVLSAFNGENPQGVWKLRFRDVSSANTGQINSASLSICSSVYTSLASSSFEINDFVLYPNPNKGIFTVRFKSVNTDGVVVMVNDMLGRKIYENKFESKEDFSENIHLKNVTPGVYIVSVTDGDRKGVSKIVIK
ncbi:reprolysin-like metallopeptidase [Flavobacterium aestivum]|uniref:zinc-dependent metalloprotease n=1 Tax=Flavobacterium aestivum TaxID=3003257 RepID=UPI0022854222|nr:zinc-dependent metalloprotease family protein [Flavobacterium aestivum]